MKRTPLERRAPITRTRSSNTLTRKGLRRVSVKQRAVNSEYATQRDVFLGLHDRCEVENCRNESMHVHHVKGRDGALMLDVSHWLACCNECHAKIHANPAWAYQHGYMVSRHTKRDSE